MSEIDEVSDGEIAAHFVVAERRGLTPSVRSTST